MHAQLSVPPKTLLLCDGRKGGTGKTTVAMAAVEYLMGAVPYAALRAYDLDGIRGDLFRRYPGMTAPVSATSVDAFGSIIDDLTNPASGVEIAVVDVGAPAGEAIDRFLIEAGPLYAAESGFLRIAALWVVGSTPRSMEHLSDALTAWDDAGLTDLVDLTIVANEGQGSRFDFVTASTAAADLPLVHFPRLDEEAAQEAANFRCGFGEYVNHPRTGDTPPSFARQSIVRRWLGRTAAAFDHIPLLASLTQAPSLAASPGPEPLDATPMLTDALDAAPPAAQEARDESLVTDAAPASVDPTMTAAPTDAATAPRPQPLLHTQPLPSQTYLTTGPGHPAPPHTSANHGLGGAGDGGTVHSAAPLPNVHPLPPAPGPYLQSAAILSTTPVALSQPASPPPQTAGRWASTVGASPNAVPDAAA
ncbi:hypothetical protein [Azospirillum canadense]|uniref:hypothetical protein n=1 Tax=Azospirillum canadense TaxID=403962 RepID=UPI002225E5A0|nr:hypothetical protein [Azospirillum canadense]MCW2240773.1 hypothetical protein [Azospirillum canadense]